MPQPCPNCGMEAPEGAALCPNCGANLHAPIRSSFTRIPALDYFLGILAGVGGLLLFGVGAFVVFAIALYFQKKSIYFLYGVGTVIILVLLLFLGLVYACSHTSF